MNIILRTPAEAFAAVSWLVCSADRTGSADELRFLYEKVCTLDVFEDCSLVEFQNMFGTTFSKLFQNRSNGELAIPTQDIDTVIQAVTEALTPVQRAEAFQMAVGLAYADGVCDLEESILDRLRIGLGIAQDVAKQMLSVH